MVIPRCLVKFKDYKKISLFSQFSCSKSNHIAVLILIKDKAGSYILALFTNFNQFLSKSNNYNNCMYVLKGVLNYVFLNPISVGGKSLGASYTIAR